MKTDAVYLRELRAILGPRACIGVNHQMGMLGAFVTDDYQQAPYVVAGDEESLIRLAREKRDEERIDTK